MERGDSTMYVFVPKYVTKNGGGQNLKGQDQVKIKHCYKNVLPSVSAEPTFKLLKQREF